MNPIFLRRVAGLMIACLVMQTVPAASSSIGRGPFPPSLSQTGSLSQSQFKSEAFIAPLVFACHAWGSSIFDVRHLAADLARSASALPDASGLWVLAAGGMLMAAFTPDWESIPTRFAELLAESAALINAPNASPEDLTRAKSLLDPIFARTKKSPENRIELELLARQNLATALLKGTDQDGEKALPLLLDALSLGKDIAVPLSLRLESIYLLGYGYFVLEQESEARFFLTLARDAYRGLLAKKPVWPPQNNPDYAKYFAQWGVRFSDEKDEPAKLAQIHKEYRFRQHLQEREMILERMLRRIVRDRVKAQRTQERQQQAALKAAKEAARMAQRAEVIRREQAALERRRLLAQEAELKLKRQQEEVDRRRREEADRREQNWQRMVRITRLPGEDGEALLRWLEERGIVNRADPSSLERYSTPFDILMSEVLPVLLPKEAPNPRDARELALGKRSFAKFVAEKVDREQARQQAEQRALKESDRLRQERERQRVIREARARFIEDKKRREDQECRQREEAAKQAEAERNKQDLLAREQERVAREQDRLQAEAARLAAEEAEQKKTRLREAEEEIKREAQLKLSRLREAQVLAEKRREAEEKIQRDKAQREEAEIAALLKAQDDRRHYVREKLLQRFKNQTAFNPLVSEVFELILNEALDWTDPQLDEVSQQLTSAAFIVGYWLRPRLNSVALYGPIAAAVAGRARPRALIDSIVDLMQENRATPEDARAVGRWLASPIPDSEVEEQVLNRFAEKPDGWINGESGSILLLNIAVIAGLGVTALFPEILQRSISAGGYWVGMITAAGLLAQTQYRRATLRAA